MIHFIGIWGTLTLPQALCPALGKGTAPRVRPLEELTVWEVYLQIKAIRIQTEGRKPLSPGAIQQTLQRWIVEEVMMYDEPELELLKRMFSRDGHAVLVTRSLTSCV